MSGITDNLEKIFETENLTPDLLVPVLEAEGSQLSELFEFADQVRRQYCGDTVHIRAILEFSNHCRCDCAYCGLFAGNKNLTRFRMTPEEIVGAAQLAAKAGYRTLVLQSGEDLWYSKERMGEIIREIKAETGLVLTLSVGERPFDDYAYWKSCGADRFLIKHETADRALYDWYHPPQRLPAAIQLPKRAEPAWLRAGERVYGWFARTDSGDSCKRYSSFEGAKGDYGGYWALHLPSWD